MRKGNPFPGQKINHAAQRRNRQQFGQNRRVVYAEIANLRMPDKFFVFVSSGLDDQIAAAHVVINTQNFERAAGIVAVD